MSGHAGVKQQNKNIKCSTVRIIGRFYFDFILIVFCISVHVHCSNVCVQRDVIWSINYSSRLCFSLWTYLNSKPFISPCKLLSLEYPCVFDCVHTLIVYVWQHAAISGACVCVSMCVPSLRVCFLVPTELKSCATKAFLCSSVAFTLRWWESAAPLIVFDVVGQHTQVSLCAGVCVCVGGCVVLKG